MTESFLTMQIDPNEPVELEQESVLCHGAGVDLWDGRSVALAELDSDDNAFTAFCRSLDPNRCFIAACIPDDEGRPVFFRAREAARRSGIHMQATIDTPERHRTLWESYRQARRLAAEQARSDPGGEE